MKPLSACRRPLFLLTSMVWVAWPLQCSVWAGLSLTDTNRPPQPMRLVFIHHSTGEAWLADDHGGLGAALRDNNYFVSDTNYGWGPDGIGDTTDIGHWWRWFRGPDSDRYLDAVLAQSEQNCAYSRMQSPVAGANRIVMFKSCFPNSALRGTPNDPVPAITGNPLIGEDAYSEAHTVANAKGIYRDLLVRFGTRTNTLFVAIAAPPLSDATYAANARAFNRWLVQDWLKDYPYANVFVWDFYNVLTSNGGGPNTHDAGRDTGNHHRWWLGAVQYRTDAGGNVLAYASSNEDDHPSAAGDHKATTEFVPLLNAAVNAWLAASVRAPRCAAVRRSGDGVVLTLGDLDAGATYTVERCGDLAVGSWTEAGHWTAVTAESDWTDPDPSSHAGMFYRVRRN